MMEIEEIQVELEDRNLAVVAKNITAANKDKGLTITREYLRQIRSGQAKNPSHKVVKAISEYLEPRKEK